MSATATPTAARDAGLVAGIGLGGLVAACIAFLIGGAIFTVPRDIAAAMGAWGPLAYVAGAATIGAIMLCLAEAAARVPTSGGVYGIAAMAFGDYWGWLVGALNWASAVLSNGAIAAAAVDAAGTLVPAVATGAGRALAIVGLYLVLVAVNLRDVGTASRFVSFATMVKLVPLALFVIIGAAFVAPANLTAPLPAGHADIGRALLLALFTFTGMESALAVSGEVRDPARTIPRAIGIALAAGAGFYIAIQTVAQGLIGPALASAPAPLAAALASIAPGLGVMMAVGALISMLGYVASDTMCSPRFLFAAARDGFLPASFGRIDARHHVPRAAVVTHAAIGAALALSGSFQSLVIASTLITLLVYVIGCAAALRLRLRNVELAGPVTRLPGLWPAAAVAFAASAWLAAQSTRAEAVAITALILAVSLLYLLRRKPDARWLYQDVTNEEEVPPAARG